MTDDSAASVGIVVLSHSNELADATVRLARRDASRIRISRRPLVEGTFVTAVKAAAGDSLDDLVAAADDAGSMDKLEGR